MRRVRDDAGQPDPGFARLYQGQPDATDLEPWLELCHQAAGPVLYVGPGSGRLAVPLANAGVSLVGVEPHPEMAALLAARLPGVEIALERIESVDLGRRFELVIAPANVLADPIRLAGAARHLARRGKLAAELLNPHWVAAGKGDGIRLESLESGWVRMEIEHDLEGEPVVQAVDEAVVWPEAVEIWLAGAGLSLIRITGEAGGGLEESSGYLVLARPAAASRPSGARR